VVERRSLAGGLSLSCARPAANGCPLTWVSRPLQVSQLGQLNLSSFRGRYMSSKLIPAYGCIDFSCYFRRAQNL